jgi:CheY-like chemotaxis protein
VLCAEDGHTNRVIVQAFVQGLGHDVSFVENGQLAVQRCAEENFDLILMDGRMPVMDGLAAARAIREGGIDGAWVLDPQIWMIALDRQRHGQRPRALAGRRHERLPAQAGRRARARAGRCTAPSRRCARAAARCVLRRRARPRWCIHRRARRDARGQRDGAATRFSRLCRPSEAAPATTPIRSLAERLREAFRAETPRLLTDLSAALAERDFAHAARHRAQHQGQRVLHPVRADGRLCGGARERVRRGDAEVVETHWVNLQGSIEEWITQN